MSMITKKDAKERLDLYKQIFAPLYGKSCNLTFDQHSFYITISSIELGKVTDSKIKPDKCKDGDKLRTPLFFNILTDCGVLSFTFDDCTVVSIMNGVRIIVSLDKPINDNNSLIVDMRCI